MRSEKPNNQISVHISTSQEGGLRFTQWPYDTADLAEHDVCAVIGTQEKRISSTDIAIANHGAQYLGKYPVQSAIEKGQQGKTWRLEGFLT